jgi:hypothetical protein
MAQPDGTIGAAERLFEEWVLHGGPEGPTRAAPDVPDAPRSEYGSSALSVPVPPSLLPGFQATLYAQALAIRQPRSYQNTTTSNPVRLDVWSLTFAADPAPLVPWTAEGQQRRSPPPHAARYVPNGPFLAVAVKLPLDAAPFTQPVSTWQSGVRDGSGSR